MPACARELGVEQGRHLRGPRATQPTVYFPMSDLKLKTVTRTQGNNRALKDGTVKPKTFEFAFEEVDPLIAAFRRMVRGNEFDICERIYVKKIDIRCITGRMRHVLCLSSCPDGSPHRLPGPVSRT